LIFVNRLKQSLVAVFDLSSYICKSHCNKHTTKPVVLWLLFAFQKRQQSLYSPFSFNAGCIGLVFPHCIVKNTKKKGRREVFIAYDEHALTHILILLFFFFFFFSSFLHSTTSMLHKISSSSSRSEREIRACRVENFIERDDEPTLRGISITHIILAYSC
jgi:hypothetical protein